MSFRIINLPRVSWQKKELRACGGADPTLSSSSSSVASRPVASPIPPPPSQTQCRFCDNNTLSVENAHPCCPKAECQGKRANACIHKCACGKICTLEKSHTSSCSCLTADCSEKKESDPCREDLCSICFTDSLYQDTILRSGCGHYFHSTCLSKWVQNRWSGNIVSLGWTDCPLCHQEMGNPVSSGRHHVLFRDAVEFRKEVVQRCKALAKSESELEAMMVEQKMELDDFWKVVNEKVNFFDCHKCHSLYYGGKKDCGQRDEINLLPASEFVCEGCRGCPKHGLEHTAFKCRHCCSVATWFCFGHTHFCEPCHSRAWELHSSQNYNRLLTTPVPCKGPGSCPFDGKHPPNGQEFQIGGCRLCEDEEDQKRLASSSSSSSSSNADPAPAPAPAPAPVDVGANVDLDIDADDFFGFNFQPEINIAPQPQLNILPQPYIHAPVAPQPQINVAPVAPELFHPNPIMGAFRIHPRRREINLVRPAEAPAPAAEQPKRVWRRPAVAEKPEEPARPAQRQFKFQVAAPALMRANSINVNFSVKSAFSFIQKPN
eukprot:TRINITY_DN334_c2_g1_i2.p1 TRINITY_DN334_c2_g1~~TRINITY_DN334_c2_g1_i2.p1  ORF type:complete len:576 (-),score=233.13 TRINITY_DN334_c2_g1_i2:131-1768(-)